MKKHILYIAFVFVGLAAQGQQQALFTNYLLNDYYYNPAIAGSKNVHIASMSYRNQWTGFDGAPITIMGSYYGSVRNLGKHGYGVSLISDKTGITQRTSAYLNYAHHFNLGKKVKLGLGIQPGYIQYRIKLYDAQVADQGDDVLTGNVFAANAIDFNGGFNVYSERFFFMASVSQILGKEISFTTYNPGLSKHYSALGGINFSFGKKKKFVLQPSFLLKYTQPVPFQYTAMLKGTVSNKYWMGLAYRSDDAASVCLGYNVKERLNIGYGFDYSLSGISKYQSGTHEIVLSYIITKKKPTLDQKDEELNNSIMDEMKKKNKKETE